jgi:DNA-binding NarL/FixJ family response regulator
MLGAASGGEALRILEREKPDIVVADLYLPGIKGIDFVDWLRSSLPYAAVVVLSRKDSLAEVREVIRRGVWDYLEKPVQMAEMVQALNGALEQARLVSGTCDSKKTEAGGCHGATGSPSMARGAH